MDRLAKKMLPPNISTALYGASRDFQDSSGDILFAFLLALLLIYLVLSAQFESFIDPLIIMLTVPLAMAGAVLSLWIFGQTLNIFSEIGIISLIGLVSKNSILIVEFANHLQEKGMAVKDAIVEAAIERLRPILMTTLAMALGALPIALAFGAGATSRKSLGIVIVGGLMFALILTLFVIPAIYLFKKYMMTIVTLVATLIIVYLLDNISMLLPYKILITLIGGLIVTACILHIIKLARQNRTN